MAEMKEAADAAAAAAKNNNNDSGKTEMPICKSGGVQRVAILAAQTDAQPILAERLAENSCYDNSLF